MSPRAVVARVASGVALLVLGAPLTSVADSFSFAPYPLENGGQTHTVTVATQGDPLRTYQLTTTAPQRDNAAQQRAITERAGELQARSGNVLFDALLAQALDDARLDSVSSIRDFAYNDNQPIPCECFQTGEKWTYVWTRDTSYSTDLGLALLDPVRAATSLRFKISGFRTGMPLPPGLPADSLQIVQDTGSGGSWPVSSDRLTWALGAAAVLDQLDGDARKSFALEAYRALRGSLEADRAAIFDATDGLYSGEQSFLDWREQTYAPYVLKDLTQLAQTKALSTNVVHYAGLKLAARLAHEQHDAGAAARYTQQAEALKTAINDRLWLPELGLYASITTPDAHAAPVAKFDMLGEALAIVTGVASEARGRKILANYPHAPFGVPVYYPQQPDVAVYHNRAIWAFVSAYELLAAAQVENTAVADNAFDSLTRAAALHLTNTENLEWLTGKSHYDDGPVINSRRQIWSVAGYVAMVAKVVFGFNVREDGVHIAPFLTAHMRDTLAGDAGGIGGAGADADAAGAGANSGGGARTATLANLNYRGRSVRVVLHLPSHAASGWFPVAGVTLNGQPVTGAIAATKLQADNVIDVRFGAATAGDARIRMAAQVSPLSHDDPQIFSPAVPELALESGAPRPTLSVTNRGPGITYDIWRDGVRVERGWSGDAWTDAKLAAAVRHCYRVVARYTVSNNASHPSEAACVDAGATRTIAWSDASVQTLPGSHTGGPDYRVRGVQIAAAGDYALSLTYDNHDFFINTGVTNAVKRLQVQDAQGRVVASAIVQMPHIGPEGAAHPLRQSTDARLHLPAGNYSVLMSDYFNMSYLQSNALFREIGGSSGARNRATISALRITRWR